jgi:hypothetical protein
MKLIEEQQNNHTNIILLLFEKAQPSLEVGGMSLKKLIFINKNNIFV